jgi:hypothetical protein
MTHDEFRFLIVGLMAVSILFAFAVSAHGQSG